MTPISSSKRRIRPNRSAAWHVFSIAVVVYFFSAKGSLDAPDPHYSFETAQAIVTHGQLEIAYASGFTLQGLGGRNYSKSGIGLPLFYLPAVAVGDALVRGPGRICRALDRIHAFLCQYSFRHSHLGCFLQDAPAMGSAPGVRSGLSAGPRSGPLVWRYACYGFSEGMQMGLLTLAVYTLMRRTPRVLIAGGIAFGWLVLVKLMYLAYLPGSASSTSLRARQSHAMESRKTALFIFPIMLAGVFDLWLNFIRFGDAFESGYGSVGRQVLSLADLANRSVVVGFAR